MKHKIYTNNTSNKDREIAILKEKLKFRDNAIAELVQELKIKDRKLKKYESLIINITELQKLV